MMAYVQLFWTARKAIEPQSNVVFALALIPFN